MDFFIFIFLHLALLFFYGVFGMTLLPEFCRRPESRDVSFLISPLLGAAVWLAFTVGIGTVLPYDALFLGASAVLALIWIFVRWKKLFPPENPRIWCLPFAAVVFSAVMSRLITPSGIDGGLYFIPAIYDHVKCAIVGSIASRGLPPVNPWLADGGVPLPLVYYYGWHAWTAQLPILTGCDAFFAECAMTGFTFAAVLLGIAGVLAECCGAKHRFVCIGCLFVLFICDSEYTGAAGALLPESWMRFFSAEEFPGFWNLYDNFIWSPQHMFAAAAVILILRFHDMLLRSGGAKTSAPVAALLGLFAAATVLTSVYSGCFALLLIAALMLWDYLRNGDFRLRFNRAFGWQIFALAISLALTAFYLKYLFAYPPENPPVGFGMMPCFGEVRHLWQYPFYFLQFYLCILPMRCGIVYVCGMLAVFWPGILPEHPLTGFFKKYVIASFLAVFFIHSTFYSNDFGWRFPAAPQFLLAGFSVFLLRKIYGRLIRGPRSQRVAAVVVAVFIAAGAYLQYENNFRHLEFEPSLHRAFARAMPGWEVVRAHTGKDDLVLCNPDGFYDIGRIAGGTQSTNVFFSLYARRYTPVADLIFSKCYSEFFPQDRLEELYGRAIAVFAGNPSAADADYLADDLKVRAVLVTPLDGLWHCPGRIESRFPMKEETPDFRVYWRKK